MLTLPGLWLSTSFTTEYDDKTVSSFLEGMKERDIPLEVFHYVSVPLKLFHSLLPYHDRTAFGYGPFIGATLSFRPSTFPIPKLQSPNLSLRA